MLVPKDIIQEIKDRLDIVELIREYIPSVKRTGKNWVCLCPFHNDHNPSLNVSPDLGIFKCFSCGTGGDIFGFVQKIENVSFAESIRILAKKAGVELNEQSKDFFKANYKREELVQFNSRLIKLFQFFLLERKEGTVALDYLKKRGMEKDIIEVFKIGYAPRGYNTLINIVLKKGFKEEFLIETGVFIKGERGLRPLFFDRIIFPIINHNDECIGFGGRALEKEAMPKYINTPETMLYKKSKNLYGLNTAKKSIREEKKAYLVEGYMDVIGCYKGGLLNCVAPCGTAVTRDQILMLNRYTDELVLFLDGDEAGNKGVEKAIRESANTLIKKSVIMLPDNTDPDEYFKTHSIDDLRELEKASIDGFDFLVKFKLRNIDKNDYKKLISGLNSIFDFINLEENEVVRNSMVERAATILNIDKGIVAREFITYRKKNKYKSNYSKNEENEGENKEENIINRERLDRSAKRELDLILFLLLIENPINLIKKCSLREEHFSKECTQILFKSFFLENLSIDKKNFIDHIDDNIVKNYMQSRLFSEEFTQPENRIFNNVIDRIIDIIKSYYKRIKDSVNTNLRLGVLYQDNELVKKLQVEKSVIINEIIKLSKLQELKK